jgi:NAD(P)-dependent dehydrogenase (short-subunit alcohol dehydrogenase family)
MNRLTGKGAIVLGAGNAGNMAQVIARRFRDEGATVVVAGRKMDELERFAGEIGGHAVACDVTDRDAVVGMAAEAKRLLGNIEISSATATIMLNDHAAYMGTKAGTDHVVRCVANEFGSVGIRANSISPGLTDTPMNAEAKEVPGLFEAFRASYPLGRWGTSDDIAAAAVFLAEDGCFMTGENLQVNGGLTLRRNPSQQEIRASIQAASGAA